MYAMTAAHPTLPIPSYARIRNPANGREIVVRINDRGPFHPGRIVDLSYAAALRLDLLRGVAPVELDASPSTTSAPATGARPARAGQADRARAGAGRAARNDRRPCPAPVRRVARPAAAPPCRPAYAARSGLPIVSAALVPATPSAAPPARGFWVQLGAFRESDGAESFERRVAADVDWLGPCWPPSARRPSTGCRPARTRAATRRRRRRPGCASALGLVPMVVERR